MKFIHSIYAAVYDDLSLKTAGIVLGLLLVVGHVFAFLRREKLTAWLKKMPRDKGIGVIILTGF